MIISFLLLSLLCNLVLSTRLSICSSDRNERKRKEPSKDPKEKKAKENDRYFSEDSSLFKKGASPARIMSSVSTDSTILSFGRASGQLSAKKYVIGFIKQFTHNFTRKVFAFHIESNHLSTLLDFPYFVRLFVSLLSLSKKDVCYCDVHQILKLFIEYLDQSEDRQFLWLLAYSPEISSTIYLKSNICLNFIIAFIISSLKNGRCEDLKKLDIFNELLENMFLFEKDFKDGAELFFSVLNKYMCQPAKFIPVNNGIISSIPLLHTIYSNYLALKTEETNKPEFLELKECFTKLWDIARNKSDGTEKNMSVYFQIKFLEMINEITLKLRNGAQDITKMFSRFDQFIEDFNAPYYSYPVRVLRRGNIIKFENFVNEMERLISSDSFSDIEMRRLMIRCFAKFEEYFYVQCGFFFSDVALSISNEFDDSFIGNKQVEQDFFMCLESLKFFDKISQTKMKLRFTANNSNSNLQGTLDSVSNKKNGWELRFKELSSNLKSRNLDSQNISKYDNMASVLSFFLFKKEIRLPHFSRYKETYILDAVDVYLHSSGLTVSSVCFITKQGYESGVYSLITSMEEKAMEYSKQKISTVDNSETARSATNEEKVSKQDCEWLLERYQELCQTELVLKATNE